jgi:two-component system sensor histidine kinase EvgS
MFAALKTKSLYFFKNIFLFGVLISIAAESNAQNILSKSEQIWLDKNKDSIVFSVECNYAPFIFEDENGIPQGVSIDIAKEIEKILNIKFLYKKCQNLPDILDSIKNNKTDFVSSVKETQERKKYMIFSETYIEIPAVIVSSKKNKKVLNLSDLTDYKIAIAEETGLYYEIKETYPEYQIHTYKTEYDCLNGLVNEEVDVTITDAASFSNFKTINSIKNIKVSNVIPFSYNLSFGAPIHNDTIITIINKAINQISSKQKRNILNSWVKLGIEKTYNIKKLLATFFSLFGLIIIAFLIVFTWNRMLNKKVFEKTRLLNAELLLREEIQNELTVTNIKLKQAKEKAEESDRLKSAFLANLTHEIRTPMNGMLGFSKLLSKKNLDDKTKEKYIKIIHSSGNQLLSIINDIIEISHLDTNQVAINNNSINLNDMLFEIQKELKITIPVEKKIELILDLHNTSSGFLLETDAVKLKQIITNLISNAIKYSLNGSIKFGYQLINSNTVQFFVKDSGIGIKKENLDIIFERFRQINTDYKIFQQGSGLGLSICKSYVELLGGKIWVESEYEKGSDFYFTIPYKDEN